MIEFRCHSCEKLLRVQDSHAGSRARCPSCGELLSIPATLSENVPPPVEVEESPYISPSSGEEQGVDRDSKLCPFCCETIKRAAKKCKHCGEQLDRGDEQLPRKFDIGRVMSFWWKVFMKQPGMVIGTSLVASFLPALFYVPLIFVLPLLAMAGQNNDDLMMAGVGFGALACFILAIMSSCVLAAGMFRVLEKLVREEPVEFREMFLPLHLMPRVIGLGVVLTLMYLVGCLACFIPGILVLLIFWPAIFLIHEEDCGVFDSLSRAKLMTDNKWLNSLIVGIVCMAIQNVGVLLLYVGLLISMPMGNLLLAACYVSMRWEYEDEHGPLSASLN